MSASRELILRLLWPIWAIEFCIVAFNWLVLSKVSLLSYGLLFVSLVVLPFFAGRRLRGAGISPARCVFWGPTISVVGFLWALVSAFIGHTTWGEFGAFLGVTVVIGVGPQSLFSFLGAKYGTTLFRIAP